MSKEMLYNWLQKEGEYSVKTKINNQTIEICFQSDSNMKDTIWWNIYLNCYNKRKNRDTNLNKILTTGTNGIKNLLFAKRAIIQFEGIIKEEWKNSRYTKHILYCTWLDNRRKRVYEYGLKPLGYSFSMLNNKKVISKTIII